jgi:hypothetical protein
MAGSRATRSSRGHRAALLNVAFYSTFGSCFAATSFARNIGSEPELVAPQAATGELSAVCLSAKSQRKR